VIACTLALPLAPAAQSGKVTLRLATFVPEASVWGKHINQMRADWVKSTEGRVSVTPYFGGTRGDDAKVLQQMRLDALQAASLVTGLPQIDSSFSVFSVPFFFDSYDELAHVVKQLTPVLRKKLEAEGYVLLNWGYGGWAHIFTRRQVSTVADLKKSPIFTSAGDDEMVQWYKRNGFEPRALALTDVPTGLKTGMIEALPTTPLAALTLQWYSDVPHMIDVGLAPVMGATIITSKAWDRIGESDRTKMLEAAGAVEARLLAEVPKQDAAAVVQMKARGLKVVAVDLKQKEWQATAASFIETMRGAMVPADVLDLATRERDAFRKTRAAGRDR
jgi:TRAP-type C4-dicarboxylate transport system substrate-binding protein